MTEPEITRVREVLVVRMASAYFQLWDELPEKYKDNWRNWVDREILSIKGLCVEADDQSLPKIVGDYASASRKGEQAKMLQSGFKRVYKIGKENKDRK